MMIEIIIYWVGFIVTTVVTALWCRYIPGNMIKYTIDVNYNGISKASAVLCLIIVWPVTLSLIVISAACRLWSRMAGLKQEEE